MNSGEQLNAIEEGEGEGQGEGEEQATLRDDDVWLAVVRELLSTVHAAEQWRQGSVEEEEKEEEEEEGEGEGEGEGEEPATLGGGNVWLAVVTAEADGELTVQCSPLFIVNFLFPLFLLFFLRASGYYVVTQFATKHLKVASTNLVV